MTPMSLPERLARLTDAAPLVIICAWCSTFDRTDPVNAHASHTICEPCQKRVFAEAGTV